MNWINLVLFRLILMLQGWLVILGLMICRQGFFFISLVRMVLLVLIVLILCCCKVIKQFVQFIIDIMMGGGVIFWIWCNDVVFLVIQICLFDRLDIFVIGELCGVRMCWLVLRQMVEKLISLCCLQVIDIVLMMMLICDFCSVVICFVVDRIWYLICDGILKMLCVILLVMLMLKLVILLVIGLWKLNRLLLMLSLMISLLCVWMLVIVVLVLVLVVKGCRLVVGLQFWFELFGGSGGCGGMIFMLIGVGSGSVGVVFIFSVFEWL